jgi:LPPG:FO 2-phospho-L-lactate transferase
MKVTALAGGVGGAKLLVGLQTLLHERLTVIVNTGDDAFIYGVHVCPDLDIVTYWLAGLADTERGWGLLGDTFEVVDGLAALGADGWFRLGDRDLATCLYRTMHMRDGKTLTSVTDEIRRSLNVEARILPASDDAVSTRIVTADGRTLEFQEYFVRERHAPEVADVHFEGISDAGPAPGVIEAIAGAETVLVCPSNPILSVGPIIGLPGVRDALRAHPLVVAVTPIIRGAALKGPADRILASLGHDPSASGVASLYADFADVFVVDASDRDEVSRVEALGIRAVALDTIMNDAETSARLAKELLEL